jgi:hypothetical protein
MQFFNGMRFKPYPAPGGTIVTLAGGEAIEFADTMVSFGMKSILSSYFYLRRKFRRDEDTISRLIETFSKFDYVFMDSGGYTLQQARRRGEMKISMEEYLEDYYSFAERLQGHVTVFGALDALDEKYSVHKMYKAAWEAKSRGIHIAPTVFCKLDTSVLKDYAILENFDIIGLSGAGKDRRSGIKTFAKLKEASVKVHGYAMTSQEHFRLYKFYSVDSITWLSAQRFGQSYDFRGGKLRTYSPNKKDIVRNYLKPQALKHGVDIEALDRDKRYAHPSRVVDSETNLAVNQTALISWKKLYDQERRNKFGAYWNNCVPTILGSKGLTSLQTLRKLKDAEKKDNQRIR